MPHSTHKHHNSRNQRLSSVKYKDAHSRRKLSRQELCFGKTYKFPSPWSLNISGFHIILGLGAGALTITGTLLEIGGSYYGAGFWGSFFFVASGCMGIYAYRQRNLCSFAFYVILTSLSMVAALFVIILATVSIGPALDRYKHMPEDKNKRVLMHVLSLSLGVLELFTCIFTFVISYKVHTKSAQNKRRQTSHSSNRPSRTERPNSASRKPEEGRLRPHKQHKHTRHQRSQRNSRHSDIDPNSSMAIADDSNDPFSDHNISIIQPIRNPASNYVEVT